MAPFRFGTILAVNLPGMRSISFRSHNTQELTAKLKYSQASIRTTPYISFESIALISICALDAVLTAFLVSNGLAHEANPLMRPLIEHGIGTFFLVKSFPIFLLVILGEWYKKYNLSFVKKALRTCIAAYVILYFISTGLVNLQPF